MADVILQCVPEGRKLRVKMMTPGYLVGANCQFPRDLRVAGRKFQVPTEHVKLRKIGASYFYAVSNRSAIKIIDTEVMKADTGHPPVRAAPLSLPSKIFQDENDASCAVCLTEDKSIVFIPCGHYYTCASCSDKLPKCPICRVVVQERINKGLFDMA